MNSTQRNFDKRQNIQEQLQSESQSFLFLRRLGINLPIKIETARKTNI